MADQETLETGSQSPDETREWLTDALKKDIGKFPLDPNGFPMALETQEQFFEAVLEEAWERWKRQLEGSAIDVEYSLKNSPFGKDDLFQAMWELRSESPDEIYHRQAGSYVSQWDEAVDYLIRTTSAFSVQRARLKQELFEYGPPPEVVDTTAKVELTFWQNLRLNSRAFNYALWGPLLPFRRTMRHRERSKAINAKAEVAEALIETVIIPAWNETLGGELQYSTTVANRFERSRLAEGVRVDDPVRIGAHTRIEGMLKEMRLGSVGLAGPRGAGKTQSMKWIFDRLSNNPSQDLIQPRQDFDGSSREVLVIWVSAPVSYQPREFVLYLYEEVLDQVRKKVDPTTYSRLGRLMRRIPGVNLTLTLGNEAEDQLERIQFQRSFSSGWGGSLGFSGSSLELKAATELAERSRSIPQLARDFKLFVDKVLKSHFAGLMILVDELDKMSSEADAERFLNELKNLFGVEGSYFLISVSENAMSRFERRGIPFRDAFDSALDEVVDVRYLQFYQSVTLINRRVLQVPIPLLFLASCLSGGLPRDLIRISRSVLEKVDRLVESGQATLSEITRLQMAEEIRDKIRATEFAANLRLSDENAGALIRIMRSADLSADSLTDCGNLQNLADGLLQLQATTQVASTTVQKREIEESDVKDLCGQLGTYLVYANALLQFMQEHSDAVYWKDICGNIDRVDVVNEPDPLNVLAGEKISAIHDVFSRARQSLGQPPEIVFDLLRDCIKQLPPGTGVQVPNITANVMQPAAQT